MKHTDSVPMHHVFQQKQPRHLLDINDLSFEEINDVMALAKMSHLPLVLERKGVALLFEKQSARTRNSMEIASIQLGGHPITIQGNEVSLDVRESVEDVTRTLCRYHHVIGARVFSHSVLERMTNVATVPVINMLSDTAHPIQALADLLTLQQLYPEGLEGKIVTYVGDGNNMVRSLAMAVGQFGAVIRVASPAEYTLPEIDKKAIQDIGVNPIYLEDPVEAAHGADVIYTDAWYSMGQEEEASIRRPIFEPYRVTTELLSHAKSTAVFMHCLPAHRGDEVVNEVVDGNQSHVWIQAENRLHSARGLLAWVSGLRP